MICHQRRIRDEKAASEPRPVMASLEGCLVEPIAKREAAQVIIAYEWLGDMGKPIQCYGLRAATGELAGVVTFGRGPPTARTRLFGGAHLDKIICLERGACVHWAHPHAASFLIPRAIKMASAVFGWEIFFAYSDPEAREIGTIYQATNWIYLGLGPGHPCKDGKRAALRPPDDFYKADSQSAFPFPDPVSTKAGDPARYWSTRKLRSGGPPFNGEGTYDMARHLGFTIEYTSAKHLYLFISCGSRKERKAWLAELAGRGWTPRPYPKRG